jgi:molecular chaperone GrpE
MTMNNPEMKETNMEAENNGYNINADENIDGTQHLNEPVTEEPETEALKEQIAQLNDKYLRQAAEFDNFRRRTAKERVELIQTASKDLIKDLLDVLDDSDRAQEQLEKTDDAARIKEGVQLVFNKFRNTLTAKGLKQMEAVGTEFDPDLHDAVTEIEAGEEMKGKVVAEVQKGYYLNDKILRHAKVVVGR